VQLTTARLIRPTIQRIYTRSSRANLVIACLHSSFAHTGLNRFTISQHQHFCHHHTYKRHHSDVILQSACEQQTLHIGVRHVTRTSGTRVIYADARAADAGWQRTTSRQPPASRQR